MLRSTRIGRGCRRGLSAAAAHGGEELADPNYFEAGVTPGSEFLEVFCNGIRVTTCIKADRAQGWASYYVTSNNGHPLHDCFDRTQCAVRYGEITFKSCHPGPFVQ